jgi:hypothetical protein
MPPAPPPEPCRLPPPLPPPSVDLEDDAEMRDIFLEEAREVIDAAGVSLSSWSIPRRRG